MWWTNSLCILPNEDLGILAEYDPLTSSLVPHGVIGRRVSRNVASARCSPFQYVGDCIETCVHGADASQVAIANHASDDGSSFDLLSSELGNVQAESMTHVADASKVLSQVTSCWSESFLVVPMVTVTKMMTKAGEARGLVRRNDVFSGEGRPPAREKGISRHRNEGIFPLPPFRELLVWSSRGLTGGQRRRLLRDVHGACNAFNWTHGEDSRTVARPPSLVAREDKHQNLRADVLQRHPGGHALG